MDETELAKLPPEVLKQMVSLGTISEEQAAIAEQLKIATSLRYGDSPKGQHTGRTYVSANPLEHLSSMLEKGMAGRDVKGLRGQQETLRGEQREGREEFMKRYIAALRGGQVQPEGAVTFGMPEQQSMGAGQAIPSGLPPQGPPPQPPLGNPVPNPPQPQIPGPMPDPYAGASVGVGPVPRGGGSPMAGFVGPQGQKAQAPPMDPAKRYQMQIRALREGIPAGSMY